MSADIVNLRRFRKAKARSDSDRQAGENRARYGRTKQERRRDADAEARRVATLDGARREPKTGDEETS